MEKFYEEYININGISQYMLHFPKESECVVLILHGGPGQSETLLTHRTVLPARNYTAVYYDQRGTGKTQRKNKSKPDTVTLDALVQDLNETVVSLRKRYPDQKIVLAGHSWGSILGTEYLKRNLTSADAYVGIGQVVNFKAGEREAFEHCYRIANEKDRKKLSEIGDYPRSLTKENAPEKCMRFRKVQAKYGLMGFRGGNMQLIKLASKNPLFSVKDLTTMGTSRKTNANLTDILIDFDLTSTTQFSLPVYFLCGKEDWQVPFPVTEQYFQTIDAPDKALFWIENAGHFTDAENPQACTAALNEICNRILSR